jgi:hypothetical protein
VLGEPNTFEQNEARYGTKRHLFIDLRNDAYKERDHSRA